MSRLSCCPCALALFVLGGLVAAGHARTTTTVLTFAEFPDIDAVTVTSRFFGHDSAVDRDRQEGELVYDYSVDLMFDTRADLYRLYHGGRWLDSANGYEGDHILQRTSDDGSSGTWTMPHDRPEILTGREMGEPDVWYSDNYLEPEAVRLGDTFFMYFQVQINPGRPLDIPGVFASPDRGADRIGVLTSPDGLNWTRFTDRGVVVNIDDPPNIALTHEEYVYVPWDADAKPHWLYVSHFRDGVFRGHVRMRSDDPRTYDWSTRDTGIGLAQLGGQIAYAAEYGLFVRITFAEDPNTGRQVPTLQFSVNGTDWTFGDTGPVLLAGSEDDDRNRNCYFPGISTLDGTGRLERTAPGRYRAIYGATTSNAPVAFEIFYAEVGAGELTLTIDGTTRPGRAAVRPAAARMR